MAGSVTQLDASSEAVHVVLVCEPQAGKMEEVETMIRDGVKVHEANANCMGWHVSKTIEQDGSDSKIILVQTWANMKAMQEHGESEDSKKTRAAMGPLLAKPPTFHLSKTLVGFMRN